MIKENKAQERLTVKKIIVRKGPGRLRSWFGGGAASLSAARKAVRERKKAGIEHVIAKVTCHGGKVVYYVGKRNLAIALQDRFRVEFIK